MDLIWLDDFLALAEHKNFSRAAEARNVTQPAFSRRIRALETWVGVSLFDRKTHAVKLTKAGECFLPTAEEVLRRLSEGRETAREEGELYEPTLRFAATHALALTFFSGWVHSLAPELKQMGKLQLVADNMQACERMMYAGQAQFLLCHYHPEMDSELHARPFQSICIGQDELIPVSAPDEQGRPLYNLPGDKAAPLPYLAYGEQSGMGAILKSARPGQSQAWLKSAFTSHMASVLAQVAREGTGMAWLPKQLIAGDLASGSLVRAGDPSWDVPVQIQVFRPRSRQSTAAENFWRLIIKKSEQPPVPHNPTLMAHRSG